jgi:hypothetical protein
LSLRLFRLDWMLVFFHIFGTFFFLDLRRLVDVFILRLSLIKAHHVWWWHFERSISIFLKLHEGSWIISWIVSQSWWWDSKFRLNWKLNRVISMRSVNHTSSNCLLLLEVILFYFALGNFSHELEVHEAALGISMRLCSHKSHRLFVVFIVRVLTMHWAIPDGSSMSLKAFITFKVLVLLPGVMSLLVIRLTRHGIV